MAEDKVYAGFWIRLVAAFIDGLILVILTLPILSMIYGWDNYIESDIIILGFWDLILSWVAPAIVTILLWIKYKATPGKMLMKLEVVDEKTGMSIAARQSIIRYLGYFISIIPLGIGIFCIIWDKRKQGFHDKFASTVVVRTKVDSAV